MSKIDRIPDCKHNEEEGFNWIQKLARLQLQLTYIDNEMMILFIVV